MVGAGHAAEAAPLALSRVAEVWSYTVPDAKPISTSSPNVAVLGGEPAVVVGTTGGQVYALSLQSGHPVPGWPASTGGAPVLSTPSVAALSSRSPDDTVFVGAGAPTQRPVGWYEAFGPDGAPRWRVMVHNPSSSVPTGVAASLAVGDFQGGIDVVAPSMGQEEAAIDARTGTMLKGFPWFTSDSGFSTPALADLYGNGTTELVEGAAQTAGLAYGVHYRDGGHIRVLAPSGNAGTRSPSGGVVCKYDTDQEVDSSPAVGPFLGGAKTGIVAGTGTFWKGASETNDLLALTPHCKLAWSVKLDGSTSASPALADVMGDGPLSVLEGTNNRHGGGSVYAINGATGKVQWRSPAPGEVMGSVVAADLGAPGQMDVLVVGTRGAEILSGRTGALLGVLAPYVGFQSSALVTSDPNGSAGITLAGYNAHDVGIVLHYEVEGSNGSLVDVSGAWPQFHHDPQLTGWAETPFGAY
jgi:PQQ-like domain